MSRRHRSHRSVILFSFTALALPFAAVAGCAKSSSEATANDPPAVTTEARELSPGADHGAGATIPAQHPCSLPSASSKHVERVLGTGPLIGPTATEVGGDPRCDYHGGEAVMIAIDMNASVGSFANAKEMTQKHLKDPVRDYAGFGDEAFVHVMDEKVGKMHLVLTTLAVRKKDKMVTMTSKAPVEKIQALENDFLRDLGEI